MDLVTDLIGVAHVLVALCVAAALAAVGGAMARGIGQPAVLGEIVVALAVGPVLLLGVGTERFAALWTPTVETTVTWIGEIGLILFLFGLSHGAPARDRSHTRKGFAYAVLGGWLPASAAGLLLAVGILLLGPSSWRGDAPPLAYVLVLTAVMSVTAVPVLARILTDTGLRDSAPGRLALSGSVAIDGIGWILLTVGIALNQGDSGLGGIWFPVAALAMLTWGLRGVLRSGWVSRVSAGRPRLLGASLACVVVAAAAWVGSLGLSPIIAAFVLGLAVPHRGPVASSAHDLGRIGAPLVPLYIVAAGASTLAVGFTGIPWLLVVLVLVIGTASKILGGYAGGRAVGLSRPEARQLGYLFNTRGLTEVVVLQLGVSAGVLTADLFVAGVVLAVVSTLAAGPLLKTSMRGATLPTVPAPGGEQPVRALR